MRAEALRRSEVIESYYIVAPRDYAVQKGRPWETPTCGRNWSNGGNDIGVPYLWAAHPRKQDSTAAASP
jgi:hypothetical protein